MAFLPVSSVSAAALDCQAAFLIIEPKGDGSSRLAHHLAVVEQLAAQISVQNINTPKFPKLEIMI